MTPRTGKADGPGLLRRALGGRPRFNIAATLFLLLIGAFVTTGVTPARAVLLAFAIAAIVFLGAIAQMFSAASTEQMRKRAREEDQGRWGLLWTSVAVTGVVLVALGLELHAGSGGGIGEIVLAAGTLVLSWLFMNVMFAIHYAHAFYGDDTRKRKRGGLSFPGEAEPDYWDFAYFAIVIGMTFQVSDVQITDRRVRRIALVHSVIAFFFNVVIIALSVNVVAGKA